LPLDHRVLVAGGHALQPYCTMLPRESPPIARVVVAGSETAKSCLEVPSFSPLPAAAAAVVVVLEQSSLAAAPSFAVGMPELSAAVRPDPAKSQQPLASEPHTAGRAVGGPFAAAGDTASTIAAGLMTPA
jgi:hypothetical protein